MNRRLIILCLTVISFAALRGRNMDEMTSLSLAGKWNFSLDRHDKGISDKWYTKKLGQSVNLPGSLAENGVGDDPKLTTPWVAEILDSVWFKEDRFAKYRTPDNFKPSMFLTPVKYYRGVAWYQKEVIIPASWKGKSVELFLERCHWETQVWVDDQQIGVQNALGTPHIYELSRKLSPGKHRISIRVNNDVVIDVGPNSHSISDHTQTNWNGIVGKIELRVRPLVRLESVSIFPDVQQRAANVTVRVKNETGKSWNGKLILSASSSSGKTLTDKAVDISISSASDSTTIQYMLGDQMELWSEFSPVVYKLDAKLVHARNGVISTHADVFGMRAFNVEDRRIQINGHPVFLRGTLECAIFPLTGYPSMEKSYWHKIFRQSKAHGLNHIRFHSWCPPEVAFEVADEMGFYLQVECSSWASQSTTLGDGRPVDRFVMEESERIVKHYGNHPSFCMLAYGNEPKGKNQKTYLSKFVRHWKEKDDRRIYTSGAGWPMIEESDFHSDSNPRIQRWKEELKSIINAQPPRSDYDWAEQIKSLDKPMVSHEIGQWCVYPNFDETKKYTGVLQPRNIEMFKETLEENDLGHRAHDFLMASGKLQALCYKSDIEAALRTPGFGGFQLLDLHDFPGQGTALVGVLDAFWDPKGYITADEYRRFCSETVPLARLPKMIYQNHETLTAHVEFAHFGAAPLKDVTVYWRLQREDSHTVVADGKWRNITLAIDNNQQIGRIEHPLGAFDTAARLTLTVGIEGTTYENDWDVFVYPSTLKTPESEIVVTNEWNTDTQAMLDQGKSVLLVLKETSLRPEKGGNVAVGFSSIFWNTSWTRGQAPHTLGILCNPDHALFRHFPTEFHSNWQWWELTHDAQAIVLDNMSPSLDPHVKMIDTWFSNRRLALLFEAKVGNGKLMISGMDLLRDLSVRPAARQLRFSIVRYMESSAFHPAVELGKPDIDSLLK